MRAARPPRAASHELASSMVLRRLLDATPVPPTNADIDGLLASFELVYAQRQAVLDAGELVIETEADRVVVCELVARQEAWHQALLEAQRQVAEQRQCSARLRGYAAPAANGF